MAQTKYTGEGIEVLEGLDPVRKRPGLYIGGTGKDGYHHLLWEVVDNSIDEVINKHATKVDVTLHADGKSATVEDNGRGIPVDMMPKFKKSALEVIFSTLHSGGKFERGKSYAVSGGLHGVGAAVVNALSSELVVTVKRDGERFEMRFERGETKGKLKKLGGDRGKLTVPPGATPFYAEKRDDDARLGIELCLQWTESTDDLIKTYVNSVPTPDGGTHDAGLRSAIVKAIRNYIATHKLDPKGVTLTAEDIREGVVALPSTYVHYPQFQSQTKNRSSHPEVAGPV